jgi:hypothetical protein
VVGDLYLNTGTIYINGSPVTTSAATGFNGGNVLFQTNFVAATSSVSSKTGAVIIPNGGLGVEGNVNIGGNLTVSQQVLGDLVVEGSVFSGSLPLFVNDISPYFDNMKQVFPFKVDQTSINTIIDSKDVEVTINGSRLEPYVNEPGFPWISEFASGKGFRVKEGIVVIFRTPARGDEAVMVVRNSSQTPQIRRYPFSAQIIALGE